MRESLKARKIADELIGYFLRNDICDISLHLKLCEIDTRITIEGICLNEIVDLDDVVESMNAKRSPEWEEEYESLLGSRLGDNEMSLLGSMVDKAEYKYEGDKLTLEVIRYR